MNIRNISTLKQGIVLGLLWTVEICVNNFLHIPLPGRDIFDDTVWIMVGVIIFLASAILSFKRKEVISGVRTGFWLGLGSGIVACLTALLFIAFGMRFILSDPLVIMEWENSTISDRTLGMEKYFVYQTLAGAVLYLVVLGVGMGFFLGLLGGVVGKYLGIILRKK